MSKNTSISAQINALAEALVADFGDDLGDVPHAIWRMHGDIGSLHIAATELETAYDADIRAMGLVLLHHAQLMSHNARAVMARQDRRTAA